MFEFKIDPRSLERLNMPFRNGDFKRAAIVAHGITLNQLAYEINEAQRLEINKAMTIRNKSLVRAMTGYKKTAVNVPISNQIARVQTYEQRRFSGWIEQATGGEDKRKRKWVAQARTGKREQGKVRQIMRFRPDKKIPKFDGRITFKGSNPGSSPENRFAIFSLRLKRIGYTEQPFMVSGTTHVKPGVYYLTRAGKLKFAAFTNKTRRVKRILFQEDALRRVLARNSPQKKFTINFEKQLIKKARSLKWIR